MMNLSVTSGFIPDAGNSAAANLPAVLFVLLFLGLCAFIIRSRVSAKKKKSRGYGPDIAAPYDQPKPFSEKIENAFDRFRTSFEDDGGSTFIPSGNKLYLDQFVGKGKVCTTDISRLYVCDSAFLFRPGRKTEADEDDIVLAKTPDVNTVSSFTYAMYVDDDGAAHVCLDDNIQVSKKKGKVTCLRTKDGKSEEVNPLYKVNNGQWEFAEQITLSDGMLFACGRQIFRFRIEKGDLLSVPGAAAAGPAETTASEKSKHPRPAIRK